MNSIPEQADLTQLKVAIVHDWLVGGGAEKVILELHRMFPEAPIYTSYTTDEWRAKLDNKVITGWLQHFGKLRKFLVLPRIWWFEHLNLSKYDLVISSSGNGEAFAVKTNINTLHVNYCHSPTHYYWRHYDEYMQRPGFGIFDPLARLGLKLLIAPLKKWDFKAAQRADVVIANSTHIQNDIKKYYQRDSVVIHPPVDTERFSVSVSKPRKGFVTSGRLAPMKRIDIAINAANKLKLPLTVIGTGPMFESWKKVAGPTVTMAGFVSDEALADALASAEGYIFPSFEDFGIAPIEALASSTPVIAFKAGGALDYVKPGVTGEFFEEQSIESLVSTLKTFSYHKYNSGDIKAASEEFSKEAFKQKLYKLLKDTVK